MIEVLLISTVDKLGQVGEVVKVADGYARNFLFPRGLAVLPSRHNIERFKNARTKHEQEVKEREAWARAAKDRLDGLTLKFQRKVHDQKLYSSVRRAEIAAQIEAQLGSPIEKAKIALENPIESLGNFPVKISLYKDIAAEVQVVVEPEQA